MAARPDGRTDPRTARGAERRARRGGTARHHPLAPSRVPESRRAQKAHSRPPWPASRSKKKKPRPNQKPPSLAQRPPLPDRRRPRPHHHQPHRNLDPRPHRQSLQRRETDAGQSVLDSLAALGLVVTFGDETAGSGERVPSYRSAGPRPVRFAIRASIRGPISSWSWKAKTKSGQPGRCSMRCDDPECRLTDQPMRRRAARTRLAFDEGQFIP